MFRPFPPAFRASRVDFEHSNVVSKVILLLSQTEDLDS